MQNSMDYATFHRLLDHKKSEFLPFKFNQTRRHHFKKHTRQTQDWSSYNQSLKRRGDMTIWLPHDVRKRDKKSHL